MLLRVLNAILISALVRNTHCVLDTEKRINGLTTATTGKIECSTADNRGILFIIENKYGFACVEESSGWTMQFSRCIVARTENMYTIVSDEDLSDLTSMNGVGTIPNADKELWNVCTFAQGKWSAAADGASKAVKEVLQSETGPWDALLADFPNGVYDVKAEEGTNAAGEASGTVNKLKYKAANIDGATFQESLMSPTSPDCSSADKPSFLVYGMKLYECVDGETEPVFAGCVLSLPNTHGLEKNSAFNIPYFFFNEEEESLHLIQTKKLYSYLGFLSTVRPMKDIAKMNLAQLCAEISAVPDAQSKIEDSALAMEYQPTIDETGENGKIYFYPGFKRPTS